MSDPRFALIAEGDTDYVVIHAALRAILGRPFLLDQLQPEPSKPKLGNGWGGVFKWGQEFRQRRARTIDEDPTLSGYAGVIIHLDADVAEKSYEDCGAIVAKAVVDAGDILPLPCSRPCPPCGDTVEALREVLLSWLGIQESGAKGVFCMPSKSTEAWLAAAILPVDHSALKALECNLTIETTLGILPKTLRIRKNVRTYRAFADTVTAQWERVTQSCEQAASFDQRIRDIDAEFLLNKV